MSIEKLSSAEAEIMELLWERRELSAREATEALPRTVARNTVRTLLERMEQKGWVEHRQVGRVFLYRAAQLRSVSIGQKVRDVVDTFCGGSPERMIAALLDYRGLRPGELERIRDLLDSAQDHNLKAPDVGESGSGDPAKKTK